MGVVDSREDIDRVLSYYTRQQVMFLDRKLGLTFYFVQLCIASYIVGYMFIYQKGYLELEQAKGAVITHASGDALSVSSGKAAERYFSTDELTYPGLENGNVFVATRQLVHKQKRDVCEDLDMPCVEDSDCSDFGATKGTCNENGFCVEPSWCDSEVGSKPEIYAMDTGGLQIWARSIIQFVKIAPERVFSTETLGPKYGVNAFTIRDLLMKCQPLPVRFEEVAELGAVIEVQFFWECNVKQDKCEPIIQARRLDTIFDPDNIGFGFSWAEYMDDKHTMRSRNEVRGIRIFFRTAGIGKKVSIAAAINKASLGAALFALGNIIADLLMTKVFKLKEKYKARKYEISPDFGDYIPKVEARVNGATKEFEIDANEREIEKKESLWMQQLDEADV